MLIIIDKNPFEMGERLPYQNEWEYCSRLSNRNDLLRHYFTYFSELEFLFIKHDENKYIIASEIQRECIKLLKLKRGQKNAILLVKNNEEEFLPLLSYLLDIRKMGRRYGIFKKGRHIPIIVGERVFNNDGSFFIRKRDTICWEGMTEISD